MKAAFFRKGARNGTHGVSYTPHPRRSIGCAARTKPFPLADGYWVHGRKINVRDAGFFAATLPGQEKILAITACWYCIMIDLGIQCAGIARCYFLFYLALRQTGNRWLSDWCRLNTFFFTYRNLWVL